MNLPLPARPLRLAAPVLGGLLTLAAALPATAAAQTPAGPAALFTATQAEEGKAVFEASCARCHLSDLTGKDDAPPLTGGYFASSWSGHKVTELISLVSSEMPYDDAGSLDEASYLRAVAYILSRNGVPAGEAPLAKTSTGVITIARD